MRLNNVRIISSVVLYVALNSIASGQTNVPISLVQTEEIVVPEAPGDNARLSKIGLLRLWYLGSPGSPSITVFVQPPSGEPRVLGSSIRSDRMLGYRALKPSAYTINVLDGEIVPDETGKLPPNTRSLASSNINVSPGSFTTVLIRNENGQLRSEVLSDVRPKVGLGPEVHVMDLLGNPDLKLILAVGDKKRELWSSGKAGSGVVSLVGVTGPVRFELVKAGPSGSVPINSFETSLNPLLGYSVIVYPDRYGNIAMAVTENANANTSADEIKALVSQ